MAGAKAELPIIMGGIPFGIIYGVTALKLGLSPVSYTHLDVYKRQHP